MKKLFSLSIILIIALFTAIKISAQSANTSLSNLATATKINHSLTPGTTNSLSLGNSTIGWRNLYLTNGLYLDNHRFINNSGSGNNFIGTDAGKFITSGSYNTAVGYNSLYNDSTGYENTAVGYNALYKNGPGYANTALGESALYSNISGIYNTAIGTQALYYNTTGGYNSATGFFALGYNSSGSYNTANGYFTLFNNSSGNYNTANGYYAMYSNTVGGSNTASGYDALSNNTTGNFNVAEGDYAMQVNQTGVGNTATGAASLESNTGSYNTGVGFYALRVTTGAEYNTAVGYSAGDSYDNGYNNVFIGANTDVNGAGYFNVIAIGQGTICTASSQVTMGNSATNSYRAYANWTNISDERVKRNIKQNVPGLVFINKLQPITYNLDLNAVDNIIQAQRKDSTGKIIPLSNIEMTARKAKEQIVYTGFIAQDVEKAAKGLNYDFSGVDAAKNSKDLYGLRYAEFVVPLVKAVQELSKMNDAKDSAINDLQNQINQLKAMIVSSANGQQTASVSSASIAQNVPNPFSNSTSISYILPQTYSSAKIIITDNKGVVLKQISLNTKGQGNVQVDAATLASGAYHYSLYVDGKMIDSRQMISSR